MTSFNQSRKGKLSWAFEELQIFHNSSSNQPAEDFTSVYLESPDVVESIENQLNDLISKAELCLKSQGYRFLCDRKPQIEKKYMIHAGRSVVIQLEDPKHPFEPGVYPAGNTHIEITLSSKGCTLRNYSCISFPASTNFELLSLIMRNTSSNGIPSEMTFEDDVNGNEYISISFQSGYGASSEPQELIEIVLCRIYQHIHFLSIASKAVRNPTGSPGVYGVIEIANSLATNEN